MTTINKACISLLISIVLGSNAQLNAMDIEPTDFYIGIKSIYMKTTGDIHPEPHPEPLTTPRGIALKKMQLIRKQMAEGKGQTKNNPIVVPLTFARLHNLTDVATMNQAEVYDIAKRIPIYAEKILNDAKTMGSEEVIAKISQALGYH